MTIHNIILANNEIYEITAADAHALYLEGGLISGDGRVVVTGLTTDEFFNYNFSALMPDGGIEILLPSGYSTRAGSETVFPNVPLTFSLAPDVSAARAYLWNAQFEVVDHDITVNSGAEIGIQAHQVNGVSVSGAGAVEMSFGGAVQDADISKVTTAGFDWNTGGTTSDLDDATIIVNQQQAAQSNVANADGLSFYDGQIIIAETDPENSITEISENIFLNVRTLYGTTPIGFTPGTSLSITDGTTLTVSAALGNGLSASGEGTLKVGDYWFNLDGEVGDFSGADVVEAKGYTGTADLTQYPLDTEVTVLDLYGSDFILDAKSVEQLTITNSYPGWGKTWSFIDSPENFATLTKSLSEAAHVKLVLSDDGSGADLTDLNLEHVDEIDLNGQAATVNFVQNNEFVLKDKVSITDSQDSGFSCFGSTKLYW